MRITEFCLLDCDSVGYGDESRTVITGFSMNTAHFTRNKKKILEFLQKTKNIPLKLLDGLYDCVRHVVSISFKWSYKYMKWCASVCTSVATYTIDSKQMEI